MSATTPVPSNQKIKNIGIDSPAANKTGKAGQVNDAKTNDLGKAGNPAGNYNVAVSDQGKEMQAARAKAKEIAMQTPDVREDKVAKIKKKIAEGSYQVDSGKVADGMLREAILEHLSTSEER